MTRWLTPRGVTASVGVSGLIVVVPSAIVLSPLQIPCCRELYGDAAGFANRTKSAVEPALGEAQEPLRHEDHHRDEDDADPDQVVFGEEARQPLPQQQKEGGADDRSDQGADAADHVED